jgi:glycogen debranching enzyme
VQREIAVDSLRALRSLVPSFVRRRVERMERLLNTSYLRLSDPAMTKAISWIKLSIDALVLERGDTLAVAGLPWNGEFAGRENSQSIAGLGLATGDYEKTAAILRALARYQDTVETHRTFGRIPDRVSSAGCSYGGVDVAPWFVREFYEHVTYANDTALARALYPVVRRSILGASKFNTTANNVMVHGPTELAFGRERFSAFDGSRPPRPGRYAAVELQLLWYFQQLIGSYVADFAGDAEWARRWESSARMTAASFDSLFIDAGSKLLYDHLDATGRGVLVRRPFPLYALEVLGDEQVQQTMIRDLTRSLLYPHGPGTLAASEPGFTCYVTGSQPSADEVANGPVSTYLLGQVTYALTRYDRGDLSYTATRFLAVRALSDGMVGAIPEYLEVRPRPGETEVRSAGFDASLAGMAEFLRAMYQDYLGIHIDSPSMTLRTEPKLPDEFSEVAFTVFSGRCGIQGTYHRTVAGEDRLTLLAPELPGPLQWQFTWLMKGGDAWKGAVTVLAGEQVTIVMNADKITAYRGSEEISLIDHWKLKGFSRKDDIAGLGFADSVH